MTISKSYPCSSEGLSPLSAPTNGNDMKAAGQSASRSTVANMAQKPFASSADLTEKLQALEVLADGVYALTAEGDPNIGAIEGEDFVVCFEALAPPGAGTDGLGRTARVT